MPVFLAVVRRAQCIICSGTWDLKAGEQPESCVHCGSKHWEWGPETADVYRIRQGLSFLGRRLNPGAISKKRQDRAKAQGQAFQPKVTKVERAGQMSRPNRGRPDAKTKRS
jgi:hypothetical protein